MNKTKITIIGGSNSAHTLIPLLSNRGHIINLLTQNPDKWSNQIEMQYTLPDNSIKSVVEGNISLISSDPSKVIPESTIIILSLPVSKYREVLHRIAPYISNDSNVYIGTIYGQGGFNWMVEEIKTKFNLNKINYFAVGLIPWITRTLEYGKIGLNYGAKAVNVVALSDKNKFDYLQNLILDDLCFNYFGKGKFVLSDNFLSLTLSVDNQIIHLSRLYSMFLKNGGEWKEKEQVPLFYKDYDDLSAEMLKMLDDDYTLLRSAVIEKFDSHSFKYMLNYLDLEQLSYNSSNENIKISFVNSETLGQIPTPVILDKNSNWVFDKSHRFFTDDLFYGLVIAKWIATELNIKVKTIDEIINWAQRVVGDTILVGDELLTDNEHSKSPYKYGTPSEYGFSSISDIRG